MQLTKAIGGTKMSTILNTEKAQKSINAAYSALDKQANKTSKIIREYQDEVDKIRLFD